MRTESADRTVAVTVASYLFLVSLAMYFAVGGLFLRHHDLGWHLAAGDLIRALGTVPATDSWSFSAGGYPWLNMSWLWDIGMSAVYGLGGFGGVIAVTVAVGAAVAALLAAFCLRAGAGILPAAFGVLWVAAALPLYQGPLDYALAAAPQTASLLFFLLFWWLLDTAALHARTQWLWPLPFLMCLWVNMHGAFLLAYALLLAYAADAWHHQKKDWLHRLLATWLACAAAMVVNPLGIGIIEAALRTLTGPASGSISEFLPFVFGREPLSSLYLLAAVFLIGWRNPAIPLAHRLLAMAFLALGLCQQRSFCYFMFTSLPLLLAGMAPRLNRLSVIEARCRQDSADPKTARRMLVACLAALVVLWPLAQMRWPEGTTFPADIAPLEEIDYIAAHYPGEKIYNHWNFGGFVIFKTRGAMPVLIDGRGGTAYPPEVLEPLVGYNREPEIIDRYRLRVALMPRYLPPQLTYFETSRQWKRVFAGKAANVYVRCDAAKPCH